MCKNAFSIKFTQEKRKSTQPGTPEKLPLQRQKDRDVNKEIHYIRISYNIKLIFLSREFRNKRNYYLSLLGG